MREFALLVCVSVASLGALADPRPQCAAGVAATAASAVSASEIPIAHTPPGGYRDHFPAPILATCTEPLAPGAPDLRGLWRTLRAERAYETSYETSSRVYSVARFLFGQALGSEAERHPVPADHPIYVYVERIEQCGDRIVDMGGGTIADARADGTLERGVHDVSAFDFETKIDVIASYEDGVFVLRPPRIPIRITRRLDAEGHMVWHRPDLGDMIVTLERIGGPCDTPPGKDWVR
ncbi:MAG TPA: hypothetical protein VMW19_16210 [Myxococcota bacterium]|nr:hypothetical protein [Myxococcota bacterium]